MSDTTPTRSGPLPSEKTPPVSTFKGLHEGKRLFVLASGPSLGDLDLSRLSRRLVMGLNRSCLAYPDAHYHCVMDRRLFDEFGTAFARARYLFTIPTCPFGIQLRLLGGEGFSRDLEQGIYSGYTISYFALQVAAYMGFAEVFFLGLDLAHRDGRTHFFGHDFHSADHERTEFVRMRRTLSAAAAMLNDSGLSVYNCSPVGAIDGFRSISFDEAVRR